MGKVINRGWEFSASYKNSAADGRFNYNVWGTFSVNKGWVDGLRSPEDRAAQQPEHHSTPILYSAAGYPWYSYYIYRTDGIFRSQEEIDRYVSKNAETGEVTQVQPKRQGR